MTVPSRLRWRCRRGTKELDTMLLRFLEREYEGMEAAGRAAFDRLLDCEDDVLIDWLLTAKERPEDARIADITRRIRAASGF